MMKCDMCYDRTSVGKRPMCATVCPSQALAYVRPEEIAQRREKPTNVFYFGNQKITTKVYMMAPAEREEISLDVVDYMWEGSDELVAHARVASRSGKMSFRYSNGGREIRHPPANDEVSRTHEPWHVRR